MSDANNEKSISLWNKVLETSLRLPFVKVDRDEFLTKELTKFCTPMEVITALEDTPLKVLNKKEIQERHFDRKLNSCLLNNEGRKIFVRNFEDKLNETIQHRKLGRKVSYKHLIKLECYKLCKHLLDIEEYKPLKMWW